MTQASDITLRDSSLQVWAAFFLRLALGVGFLSAVADRFGFWEPAGAQSVAWGNFQNFLAYTAKLNPWCPAPLIPALGWGVTLTETVLGLALLPGFQIRIASLCSGVLTLCFALAMTFTLGVHEPLTYAVFVCSAGSFLLSTCGSNRRSIDALFAKGQKP